MEYIGRDYLMKFLKEEESLTKMVKFVSLHMGREYDGMLSSSMNLEGWGEE